MVIQRTAHGELRREPHHGAGSGVERTQHQQDQRVTVSIVPTSPQRKTLRGLITCPRPRRGTLARAGTRLGCRFHQRRELDTLPGAQVTAARWGLGRTPSAAATGTTPRAGRTVSRRTRVGSAGTRGENLRWIPPNDSRGCMVPKRCSTHAQHSWGYVRRWPADWRAPLRSDAESKRRRGEEAGCRSPVVGTFS